MTWEPGPKNLITDVPGILVGNSEDCVLKSGVSVLTSLNPMTASYSVIGGAPGTRETDLLEPDKTVHGINAVVLSGGSAFGLDATNGVTEHLRLKGRGFAMGPVNVPIVPTAIIFDLLNGGNKSWIKNPYPELGRQAIKNASENFYIGSYGAGFGATTGQLKGGLGSASSVLSNGTIVGALVIVNAMGNIIDPISGKFWAAPFEFEDEYGGYGPPPHAIQGSMLKYSKINAVKEGANSTIGIVATNSKITKAEAKRIATSSHDGFSRAIIPSHLPYDGDLIFAVSTGDQDRVNSNENFAELCHASSVTMSRAIARAVYHASSDATDTVKCFKEAYKNI
jgi:D-aminopeptidase